MVKVIERPPSFGEMMGRGLGAGIGTGIGKSVSDFTEMKQKLAFEKQKQEERRKSIAAVRGQQTPASSLNPEEKKKQFLEMIPQLEELKMSLGHGEITPEDLDQIWKEMDQEQGQQQSTSPKSHEQMAEEFAVLNEHDLSRLHTELAKEDRAEKREFAKSEAGKVDEVLKKVATSRDSLLQRRADYDVAEQAINQSPGDIGSLKNYVADAFNLPMLKSASGAAFSSAMKDAYINSLRQIPGMRPNQWIEQQIQTAMARIGQSDEANRMVLSLGKFKLDLEEKYNDIVDSLVESYHSRGKPVPSTLEKDAYKQLKPYAEERQKELAYDLRTNFERERGISSGPLKPVPKGTPLTYEMAQVIKQKVDGDTLKAQKLAEGLGYEIPPASFFIKRGYVEKKNE